MEEVKEIVTALLTTIGLVALYMLINLASAIKEGEKFDRKKAMRTLIIATVIGFFIWSQGWVVTPETMAIGQNWLMTFGGGFAVVLIDKAVAWLQKNLPK